MDYLFNGLFIYWTIYLLDYLFIGLFIYRTFYVKYLSIIFTLFFDWFWKRDQNMLIKKKIPFDINLSYIFINWSQEKYYERAGHLNIHLQK